MKRLLLKIIEILVILGMITDVVETEDDRTGDCFPTH
jgi:hypothetical protein